MKLGSLSQLQISQALNSQRLNAMRLNYAWPHLQIIALLGLGIFWTLWQTPGIPQSQSVDLLRLLSLAHPVVLILILGRFYKGRAKRLSPQRLADLDKYPVLDPKGKPVQLQGAELAVEILAHDLKLESWARFHASAMGCLIFALAAYSSVLQYQPIYMLNTAPALILLGQAFKDRPRESLIWQRTQLWFKTRV